MKLKDLPVDEFTTHFAESLNITNTAEDINHFFETKKVRHIPVVEDNKVIGIISERDFYKYLALKSQENNKVVLKEIQVNEIMTERPYTVFSSESLKTVAFEMSKNKIGSAIVLDSDGNSIGIFTTTDALNALVEVLRSEQGLFI